MHIMFINSNVSVVKQDYYGSPVGHVRFKAHGLQSFAFIGWPKADLSKFLLQSGQFRTATNEVE